MNGDQLRMARALLRIGVRELAREAGINPGTVVNLENGSKGHAGTIARLRETLQGMGIVFIGALEPFHEPGVAMKWGERPPKTAAEAEAGEADEEGNGVEARPWDDAEMRLDHADIKEMRRYWGEGDRWAQLSEPGKKALRRAMGEAPLP